MQLHLHHLEAVSLSQFRTMRGRFVQTNGDIISEVASRVAWAPDTWQLNLPSTTLSADISLQHLHAFITRENALGHLVRQEAVSMIPALLLQVSASPPSSPPLLCCCLTRLIPLSSLPRWVCASFCLCAVCVCVRRRVQAIGCLTCARPREARRSSWSAEWSRHREVRIIPFETIADKSIRSCIPPSASLPLFLSFLKAN